ncbi:MAG: hypothetical protein GY795_46505 [Desulfobacterales bacterium]|nr:hypothetical protein [Desulfobacterales bacterium]
MGLFKIPFDLQNPKHQQLLYFKEIYIAEDHPERDKWEKYSQKLRQKFGFETMGFGPSKQEFVNMLEEKGLTVNLNRKRIKITDDS